MYCIKTYDPDDPEGLFEGEPDMRQYSSEVDDSSFLDEQEARKSPTSQTQLPKYTAVRGHAPSEMSEEEDAWALMDEAVAERKYDQRHSRHPAVEDSQYMVMSNALSTESAHGDLLGNRNFDQQAYEDSSVIFDVDTSQGAEVTDTNFEDPIRCDHQNDEASRSSESDPDFGYYGRLLKNEKKGYEKLVEGELNKNERRRLSDHHSEKKLLYHDLLRIRMPTESHLEDIDFQLDGALEQIKSKDTIQALHDADPTLSRQELFRIYRHAVEECAATSDQGSNLEAFKTGDKGNDLEDPGSSDYEEDIPPAEDSSLQRERRRNSVRNRISLDWSQAKSEHTQANPIRTSASDAVRSSLMQAKPYLSDVTPDDAQGHHPSIIASSPQRGLPKIKSLSVGNSLDISNTAKQPQQLTEQALMFRDTKTSPDQLSSPVYLHRGGPLSPFSRPGKPGSFTKFGQSNPPAKSIGSIDAASAHAHLGSPVPGSSGGPSRPGTLKPSLTGLSLMDQVSQASMLPVLKSEAWPLRSVAEDSSTESDSASVSKSTNCSAENISRSSARQLVTAIPTQSGEIELEGKREYHISNLQEDWQDPIRHNDSVPVQQGIVVKSRDRFSTQHQPNDAQPLHPTPLANRGSDPFADGVDMIPFPTRRVDDPPALSPFTGLAGSIFLAKRGERKRQTATKAPLPKQMSTTTRMASRKSTRKTKKPEEICIDAPPKRVKSTALGVQGTEVKISKARLASRNISGKTGGKKKEQEKAPPVPALPVEMDLDSFRAYRGREPDLQNRTLNGGSIETLQTPTKPRTPSRNQDKTGDKEKTAKRTPRSSAKKMKGKQGDLLATPNSGTRSEGGNRLIPQSAAKGHRTPPTRRSPRIAKMKEKELGRGV